MNHLFPIPTIKLANVFEEINPSPQKKAIKNSSNSFIITPCSNQHLNWQILVRK